MAPQLRKAQPQSSEQLVRGTMPCVRSGPKRLDPIIFERSFLSSGRDHSPKRSSTVGARSTCHTAALLADASAALSAASSVPSGASIHAGTWISSSNTVPVCPSWPCSRNASP